MTKNCDYPQKQNTGIHDFRIAGFNIRLIFNGAGTDGIDLLPSFSNFKATIPADGKDLLFVLSTGKTHNPGNITAENIGTFDTGNGDTVVDLLGNGGYRFVIKNIYGNVCCTLLCDKSFYRCECELNGNRNMRQFGLNNALMLMFAFAGSSRQALLIHASLVKHGGYGYAFVAKSGTGKSTHTGLWLRHIPGCELMNDDNPIIRIIDGTPYIYGSPWSGKTPCYRPVKAKLGAVTKIERADRNSIERLKPIQAFATLLPSCSSMKWDKTVHNETCDNITKLIETTGIYTLKCLPDKNAAILCHKEISK